MTANQFRALYKSAHAIVAAIKSSLMLFVGHNNFSLDCIFIQSQIKLNCRHHILAKTTENKQIDFQTSSELSSMIVFFLVLSSRRIFSWNFVRRQVWYALVRMADRFKRTHTTTRHTNFMNQKMNENSRRIRFLFDIVFMRPVWYVPS